MALIKFGGGVAGISGKIGGTVYARNRAGAYARNWAKPITTPTPSQTVNRNRFGNQAQQWTLLSAADKSGWDAYAATVTRTNRQGDSYTPTGRQVFLEAANQLAAIGGTTPTVAPPPGTSAPVDVPITHIEFTVTAGTVNKVKVTGTSTAPGATLVMEATPPTGGNITNFSNLFRQYTTIPSDSTWPFDTDVPYKAAFGDNLVVGNVAAFRAKLVDDATGLAGPSLIIIATAV